jgi:hypothetical protein
MMFGSSSPAVVCISCLTYVICVCIRIAVSNTYCVVFVISFVHYFGSFAGLSIFDYPSVFSNVFMQSVKITVINLYNKSYSLILNSGVLRSSIVSSTNPVCLRYWVFLSH